MTVIFMDFPQSLSDHMPEKSDPIAHNGKQNVLVYHIRQNLLKFLQGALVEKLEFSDSYVVSTTLTQNMTKWKRYPNSS